MIGIYLSIYQSSAVQSQVIISAQDQQTLNSECKKKKTGSYYVHQGLGSAALFYKLFKKPFP